MNYHDITLEQAMERLVTNQEGLSCSEAKRRLDQYGANEITEKKKQTAWSILLSQFKNFVILILIIVAIISGIVGDYIETIIIISIVVLNAIFGFIQEYRADQTLQSLKKLSSTQASVLRDKVMVRLSSIDLVPGDVVQLEAGNVVPADIRLMSSHALRIDESSLTGESIAIDKNAGVIIESKSVLGEHLNMAYKGTLVTNGRAMGIVVNTAMNTELGKIAGLLQDSEGETPLQKRMTVFSKKLSYIILSICAVLFISGIIRGEGAIQMLMLSVSLAVAAIPEALPALITVALSRGAARLSKKNALIRKLPAVETLGSVTYICSDKTGTLTQNKMSVERHTDLEINKERSYMTLGMCLNHDTQSHPEQGFLGEPTEIALVDFIRSYITTSAYDKIVEDYPRVLELPFDSDRKCMTTVHKGPDGYIVLTKGAPESIESRLSSAEDKANLKKHSEEWAKNGYRVIAFGHRTIETLPEENTPWHIENHLTLSGYCGLIDPPRAEVKIAIEECKMAGIKPVMITGDHPETAKAIAQQIGILTDGGLVLTGAELRQIDDEKFLQIVEQVSVYARVNPDQKLRIVKALQSKSHFVSMTGDGVNDAPSLRSANIGVAMGITGTDVSKEAAHMILLDDNFATIVNAVKEGRRIYDNIRKFIKYIMTCNSAEIWTLFLAPILGMPLPLLPIHILWINLVTDGLPALALATEKADQDIMQRKPRPTNESLFADGVGYHIIWVGILMAGVTLALQAWSISHDMSHWQTMVFTVLAVSQLGHVLAIRSDRAFLYEQGIFSNPKLLLAVFFTLILQLAVIYIPALNVIFKTEPLTLHEFLICCVLGAFVFHAVELEKWLKRKYFMTQTGKM